MYSLVIIVFISLLVVLLSVAVLTILVVALILVIVLSVVSITVIVVLVLMTILVIGMALLLRTRHVVLRRSSLVPSGTRDGVTTTIPVSLMFTEFVARDEARGMAYESN